VNIAPPGWAAYQKQLRAFEDEDLYRLRKDVDAVAEHPGLLALFALVDARELRIMEELVHGQVQNVPKSGLTRQLGMVSGIRQIRDLIPCVRYAAYEREQARLREAENESSGHGATTSPDA
jgi:hypothetical protein